MLDGDTGNDTLDGGTGNDTLSGGDGDDSLSGGADDPNSGQPQIAGGDDKLDGGKGNDSLNGGDGNDSLTGGDDADRLEGDGGDDTLDGGTGSDVLYGDSSIDTSASGNDRLNGGGDNDTLYGGIGADWLDGGTGSDTLVGGIGNDIYYVDSASDVITELAKGGVDTVYASASYTLSGLIENLELVGDALAGTGNGMANTITGNDLNNSLSGLIGKDTLVGGEGNDTLDGGLGVDSMEGGIGNDTYYVDNFTDIVSEGQNAGNDTVSSTVSYSLDNNVENLTLTGRNGLKGNGNDDANTITGNDGNNALNGNGGADTLLGGIGQDALYGGADDDLLDGGEGADRMAGGHGNDTFIVTSVDDKVVESSDQGTRDVVKSSVSYTLSANVEVLELQGIGNINGKGNVGANTIIGNIGKNVLTGLGGADTLSGGAGDDKLLGNAGNDVLTGGSDADTFVFNTGGGVDRITDFVSGTDEIQLVQGLVNILGGKAVLNEGSFYAEAGAVSGADADDRLIYNTSTGDLYYDVDGSGARSAVKFATLDKVADAVPTLSFSDFIFG